MVASSIRRGHSRTGDLREAVREFRAAVAQPDMELVLFFHSAPQNPAVLGEEMERCFPGVPLVGCTTAGEFGPLGVGEGGICGVSFPSADFRVAIITIEDLDGFTFSDGQVRVQEALQRLESRTPPGEGWQTFGVLLVDGLSRREEFVTHALQGALGPIPLVGGSAADGVHFNDTQVFHAGDFRNGRGVLALLSTPLPFHVFKTQHFLPTAERLVITEADPQERIVREINGRPAAREYARLAGVDAAGLSPHVFAANPLVVMIDGGSYVRSIQKANPDGSLTLFCAIEEGVVLRLAHPGDLMESLEQAFREVREAVGTPQLTLAFDCILRRLEIEQKDLGERFAALLARNRVVGFHTYGEQLRGIHINQTLVGLALGSRGPEAFLDLS